MKFNNFLPFEKDEVLQKIHLNYRLTYLKDTALATGLEESNIQVINSLIANNNSDVVQNILLEETSISRIFEKLKIQDIEIRKEAINFLTEIFSVSKNLQMQGRMNLLSSFKSIEEFNLSIFVRECFKFRNDVIKSNETDSIKLAEADKLATNALDIFMNYLQSFPISLSELSSENKTSNETENLLRALAEELVNTTSQGLKLQIHELIKYLLESDNSICSTFYEISFAKFAQYLSSPSNGSSKDWNDLGDLGKSLAVDIINKSIIDDNYNARSYLQKYDLIRIVNQLAQYPSKILHMWVLKFHKALLMCSFMPYVTQMIKLDLLEPVVKIWDQIDNKKNMIASIVRDLWVTIDKKEYAELARHLCDKYAQVRPFLSECAAKFQPKVGSPVLFLQIQEVKKQGDDLMFNGYEDSIEDEKANDEAYKRSINFGDEAKEDRFKKLAFLTSRSQEEPEDEYLLKPRIQPNQPPKIEIETNSFRSLNKDSNSALSVDSLPHREILEDWAWLPNGHINLLDDNFLQISHDKDITLDEPTDTIRRRDLKNIDKELDEAEKIPLQKEGSGDIEDKQINISHEVQANFESHEQGERDAHEANDEQQEENKDYSKTNEEIKDENESQETFGEVTKEENGILGVAKHKRIKTAETDDTAQDGDNEPAAEEEKDVEPIVEDHQSKFLAILLLILTNSLYLRSY